MNLLVIGGTGTVGTRVVQELLKRGASVRVLTRDAEKAEKLPEGADAIIGELADPGTVRTMYDGIDGAFMLNALTPTEAHEGLMAVAGARLADLDRFVYMSVHRAEEASYLPHFGSKIAVETALKDSGIPYTILRPNHFYQNDQWSQQELMEYGVYAQPLGRLGVSRVDVRDIAEAAAIALTTGDYDGQTINLVGPEALTGPRIAAIWSDALGRDIGYAGDDLDAWEQVAGPFMPPWMTFDVRLMFEHFQQHGLKADDDDLARLTAMLGHPPRRYEAYVAELAARWVD